MTYKFRLAFRLGPQCGLDGAGDSAELQLGDIAKTARLRALGPGEPCEIATSKLFDIVADGFESAAAADHAGRATRDALLRFALAEAFELDCGLPGEHESGGVTGGFKQYVRDTSGTVIGDHALGVTVFPSAPLRVFIGGEITLRRGIKHGAFSGMLAAEIKPTRPIAGRVALAIQAWCRAGFVSGRVVRFLLLCNAVECLIERRASSAPISAAVTDALERTKTLALPDEDRSYFCDRLRELRSESISRAGQRIAGERLIGKSYRSLPPNEFFRTAYGIRSKLVHEGRISVTPDEFVAITGEYSQFALDLIRTYLSD